MHGRSADGTVTRDVSPHLDHARRLPHAVRVSLLSVALLVLPVLTAGCTGLFVAEVPSDLIQGAWAETRRDQGDEWPGVGARWAMVEYQARPAGSTLGSGPYPASLTVFSIAAATPPDRDALLADLEQQVRTNSAEQDLHLDHETRVAGTRSVDKGLTSRYFTYHAKTGSDSSLFDAAQEARVLGEVWYDEPSRIVVIAVGLAQVQGGGATGRYFEDHTNWARIAADPQGTIEGHDGRGMVWGIASH